MLSTIGCMIPLSLLLTADLALSSPVHLRSSYAVKESFNVPQKWSRVSRAPSDHVLNLQIGLKQGRFDDLERDLLEGKLEYSYTIRLAHHLELMILPYHAFSC